jgi:hypothetical protein
MNKWLAAALLLVGAIILGATVFGEPIAYAAQEVSSTIIGPLDADGNVRVHEQGTAKAVITNPPGEPVRTQDVGLPFQRALELSSSSDTGDEDCASFPVPLGKYLAIEHVAVELRMFGKNEITPDLGFTEEDQAAALVKIVTVETKVGDDSAVYPVPLGEELQRATAAEFGAGSSMLRLASDQVSIYAAFGQVRACVDHALTVLGPEEGEFEQPDVSATVTLSGRSFGPGLQLPPLQPDR